MLELVTAVTLGPWRGANYFDWFRGFDWALFRSKTTSLAGCGGGQSWDSGHTHYTGRMNVHLPFASDGIDRRHQLGEACALGHREDGGGWVSGGR